MNNKGNVVKSVNSAQLKLQSITIALLKTITLYV